LQVRYFGLPLETYLTYITMKKLLLIFIAGLSLLLSPSIAHETVNVNITVKKETTVYITKTGAKYHTSSCRYLSQSKISISKKEAISNGYSACKVCKP
jgi:hypothetical protein